MFVGGAVHSLRAACTVGALACLLSGCAIDPWRDALEVSAAYSRAIEAGDVDTIMELTDPALLARGDPASFREVVGGIFANPGPDVISIRDEARSISEPFVDAGGMHYFVEGTRTTTRADGTRMEVDNFYLLTSRDFGRTWRVFDNFCADERWIRDIAPGWSGTPAMPRQSVRITKVEATIRSASPAAESK